MERIDNKSTRSLKSSDLSPITVGLLRLHECGISARANGMPALVELIGHRSITRQTVTLGKVGNTWHVKEHGLPGDGVFRAYWLIKGKRVYRLQSASYGFRSMEQANDAFESYRPGRRPGEQSAEEMFGLGKGQRTRRKCQAKAGWRVQLDNGKRWEKIK